MSTPTFTAMAAGYKNLWNKMKITSLSQAQQAARRVLAGRARYLAVEKVTGVPWFWMGCAHHRESTCNFAGVLHNGQHIIGTGRKTTLVPKGRGPFKSWEESAIDALKLKGLHLITAWVIERLGYEFERFNGFGYISKGVNSPYVWAGSDQYHGGKYVRDGVFSSTAMDTQIGCMPTLKALCAASAEVNERVYGKVRAASTETSAAGGAGTVVTTITPQVVETAHWGNTEWGLLVAAAVVVAAVVFYYVRKLRKVELKPEELPPVKDDASDISTSQNRAGAAVDLAPGE